MKCRGENITRRRKDGHNKRCERSSRASHNKVVGPPNNRWGPPQEKRKSRADNLTRGEARSESFQPQSIAESTHSRGVM